MKNFSKICKYVWKIISWKACEIIIWNNNMKINNKVWNEK